MFRSSIDIGDSLFIRWLAEQLVARDWIPDTVLGVVRGGLFVSAALAYALDIKDVRHINIEYYTDVGVMLPAPVIVGFTAGIAVIIFASQLKDLLGIELARALMAKPRLLLLDEPTAGMNPTETREILEFVRMLRGSGMTILLIEHKLSLVMELSDRVVVLQPAPRGIVADFLLERSCLSPAERRRAPEQFEFLQQLSAALFPS